MHAADQPGSMVSICPNWLVDLRAAGLCPVHDSLCVAQYALSGLAGLCPRNRDDAIPGPRADGLGFESVCCQPARSVCSRTWAHLCPRICVTPIPCAPDRELFCHGVSAFWRVDATLEHLTGEKDFSAWAIAAVAVHGVLQPGCRLRRFPAAVRCSLAYGFVVSVWLVLTKRYAALTLVVAIGTLNRETIIFIPLFLALYTWFRNRYLKETLESGGSG